MKNKSEITSLGFTNTAIGQSSCLVTKGAMRTLHLAPILDFERMSVMDFARVSEAGSLSAYRWAGRGNKNGADEAASDAMRGAFGLMDISGRIVIGEGIKDQAPGIFRGEKVGRWQPGSPAFDIAIDPIDGTTNLANGRPNAISVLCAASVTTSDQESLRYIPSFYCSKISYGPRIKAYLASSTTESLHLENSVAENLAIASRALGKPVQDLTVLLLDRSRNQSQVESIRREGATVRMIGDGDIAAAIAPALPGSNIDLYMGIGGSPEGVIAAAAIKAMGGDIQLRMWPRDEVEKAGIIAQGLERELREIFFANDLVRGKDVIFCATGICDSPLLKGVRIENGRAITHTLLVRARFNTVRFIEGWHDLNRKTLRWASDNQEHVILG